MGLTGFCKKKVSPSKIGNSLKLKSVYVCKGKNIQEEKEKKKVWKCISGLQVVWTMMQGWEKNKKLIKPRKSKISNREKKPIRKLKKKHSIQFDFGFVRLKPK